MKPASSHETKLSINSTRSNGWLEWITRYHDKSIDFTLERINVIARELNLTSFDCPVITVAGTNGKGTTIATMEALLLATGKRTGAYTSPHFFKFNERIRLNGINVNESLCAEAFEKIRSVAELKYPAEFAKLTFFEYATLIALYIFKQSNLDVILLEVGLGGRLDAVNVVNNNVSIITTIGLDHTEYLGNTLAEIVREKAGIIKNNTHVVCGDLAGDMQENIVREIALARGAQPHFIGQDFDAFCNNSQDNRSSVPQQNMACALHALQCLQLLPTDKDLIADVLSNISVRGRFQRYQYATGVEVIFDVAHNPPAAEWLAAQVKMLPKAGITKAIIGISANKDCEGVLKPFIDIVDEWYPITLDINVTSKNNSCKNGLNDSCKNVLNDSCINWVNNGKNFLTADIIEVKLISLGGSNIFPHENFSAAWKSCLQSIVSNASASNSIVSNAGVSASNSSIGNASASVSSNSVGNGRVSNDRIIVFGSFVTVAAGIAETGI